MRLRSLREPIRNAGVGSGFSRNGGDGIPDCLRDGIPAVSQWGLVVTVLLLLVTRRVVMSRRVNPADVGQVAERRYRHLAGGYSRPRGPVVARSESPLSADC
jgi:hypothetical protein